MNIQQVMQILSPEDFDLLVEKAYQQGSEGSGGFKVENVRSTSNRIVVQVKYENGEEAEIELSKSRAHM